MRGFNHAGTRPIPTFRLLIATLFVGLLIAAAPPLRLSPQHDHDLRCAAAFALVAGAQERGEAAALALPPLGLRGRRYFSVVGTRVADAAGLDQAAMQALMGERARQVLAAGAPAVARGCLPDLDAMIPPHPAPDALSCHALLSVYAEVLAARGPGNPLETELSAEAAALAQRAARSGPAAIDAAKSRVRQALADRTGAIDGDDLKSCRRLARATP